MEEMSKEEWEKLHNKWDNNIDEPILMAGGLLVEETDYCWQCKSPLGFKLAGCCSGIDCGCMGLPTEPPFCSRECQDKYYPQKGGIEDGSNCICCD